MPCVALPRGGRATPPQFPSPPGFFTPISNPGHIPPFNNATDNNPCGMPIVTVVGGVDVSAQNLCLPHYAMLYGQAAVPKPPDAATMLLLHMDGADLSTSFLDAAGHPFTGTANAKLSTAQSKFGGSSLLLDGGSAIYSADSPDWEFGAGDFTAETFVRFATLAAYNTLFSHWGTAPNLSWMLRWESAGGGLVFYWSADGTAIAGQVVRVWTPALNTWYHVALVRSGNVATIYIDGVQLGAVIPISGALADATFQMVVGALNSGGSFGVNGWMDEARISKVARYTANFTPPSAPYT